MRIQEFLLARVAQDESSATDTDASQYELGPNRSHQVDVFEQRRIVIDRHHDRSMTIGSGGIFQTVAQCSVCLSETIRPCRALRTLALADTAHPDYDPGWAIEPN
jgi:hypothetical protein